jgi:YesN/AraC family two-component response regulator
VITDMMMPGLSGRQVIEALRALAPKVRIIAVSGFPGADQGPLEVAATLAKPVNVAQLLGALRRVIAA